MGDANLRYGVLGTLAVAGTGVLLRVRRRAAAVVLLALTLPVGYKAFTGTHGYFAYQKEVRDSQNLDAAIEQTRRNNAKLEDSIKGLKTDPAVIQGEARSLLRYVRPGDTVIALPQPPTRTETASAPPIKKR